MKNLVLIGMPGCGKTRVGQALSRLLDMPLVDTDQMVADEAGCSIPELFEREGERAFRDRESATARRAAAMDGVIIATGGGMVLREENMAALAAGGIVFFRDRAVSDIAGENHGGRPLIGSDKERVYRLYEERIGLYRKYAQHTISDTRTVAEAARRIADIFLKEREAE